MELYKAPKKFIYFLQHPEKKEHYFILERTEKVMQDFMEKFHRTGKYAEIKGLGFPEHKFIIEEIISLDNEKQLSGLKYFIQNNIPEITHEEDEHIPLGDWGWYIIKGGLQTAKWQEKYFAKKAEEEDTYRQEQLKEMQGKQISLF